MRSGEPDRNRMLGSEELWFAAGKLVDLSG
jgi:hypothetical protein